MMANMQPQEDPIGVFLESRRYAVVETEVVEIPLVLINLADEEESYELSLVGIPAAWVTLPSPPVIHLDKAETKRVVVRIRPTDRGSRVDVRSLSRVGISDLGVNAKRIRAFLAELRSRAGS